MCRGWRPAEFSDGGPRGPFAPTQRRRVARGEPPSAATVRAAQRGAAARRAGGGCCSHLEQRVHVACGALVAQPDHARRLLRVVRRVRRPVGHVAQRDAHVDRRSRRERVRARAQPFALGRAARDGRVLAIRRRVTLAQLVGGRELEALGEAPVRRGRLVVAVRLGALDDRQRLGQRHRRVRVGPLDRERHVELGVARPALGDVGALEVARDPALGAVALREQHHAPPVRARRVARLRAEQARLLRVEVEIGVECEPALRVCRRRGRVGRRRRRRGLHRRRRRERVVRHSRASEPRSRDPVIP